VVLNEGVSVSCGKKRAKSGVLDKKINGLDDFCHFLVKFLPGRGQATKPSILGLNQVLCDMESRMLFGGLPPEQATGRHHARG